MNVLVTGGAGFIGSWLVEELIVRELNVGVIDIQNNPHSHFGSKKLNEKVTFYNQDIVDQNKVSEIISEFKPDYIFHLAAETLVTDAYNNPIKTFQSNIMGTVFILEAVRKNPFVKGVIAASSDKAYGKTSSTYTEESPLHGDHPYDVSKSSMDLICQTYYKTYNTPVVIARFGNVYGGGDLHFSRIIPGICKSIIKKKLLEIRSDGKFVRDYLYVKDVVGGYLTLLDKFDTIQGEAFNFSSNDTLSVLEVIDKVEKITGNKISYEIRNTAHNEIPYQHLNDSKVRKLGWESSYTVENAFNETFSWYKSYFEKIK